MPLAAAPEEPQRGPCHQHEQPLVTNTALCSEAFGSISSPRPPLKGSQHALFHHLQQGATPSWPLLPVHVCPCPQRGAGVQHAGAVDSADACMAVATPVMFLVVGPSRILTCRGSASACGSCANSAAAPRQAHDESTEGPVYGTPAAAAGAVARAHPRRRHPLHAAQAPTHPGPTSGCRQRHPRGHSKASEYAVWCATVCVRCRVLPPGNERLSHMVRRQRNPTPQDVCRQSRPGSQARAGAPCLTDGTRALRTLHM